MLSLRHSTFLLLAATIGSAALLAQVAPEPGEATFLVFVRGNQVGLERVALTRSGGGWIFKGSGRLAAPFDLTVRNYELKCTADWQPIDLVVAATFKGKPTSVASSFGLTTVINEISQGGQTSAKTDEISARTIVLPGNFFAAYEALAVRLAGATTDTSLRVYLVPQGEVPGQIRRVTEQTIQTPGGALALKRYSITLHRPDTPIEVEVWVDARQRLARLELPASGLTVSRQDISSVMARTETSRNPGDEPVMMPADGFSLAGTLTKQPGVSSPLPGVVLVGAFGGQDRDESLWQIPIFGQLAGAIANRGFVVVRYDKRGVGQSGGRQEAATIADYADDVRAVVRYLRGRKDVDRDRIAVVGYGDGGFPAMLAASRDGRIRSLVLLASIGTNGTAYTLERQRRELERLNLSEVDRQERIDLQKKILTAASTGSGWGDVPPELRAQADTPWFQSFLGFDPARVLTKAGQPVLIVSAGLDADVPAEHAERLAELARGRKKSPPVEIARVAGINHLLVPAKTGQPDEYSQLAEQKIGPEVATTIVEWLAKTLPEKK
jgi:pimeloyl-ACP methyl ester carboxylesterase